MTEPVDQDSAPPSERVQEARAQVEQTREELAHAAASVTESANPPSESVQEARAQVERTREELGETVGALADKVDVKAQLRRKVDQTRERVAERATSSQASASHASPDGSEPMAMLKQAADKALNVTRANPSAALIGALLVGFVLGRKSKRRKP